ncbi:OLC1v1035482C1 [Oldenlandia corymbosa var. corymbosa]|uniref:OLC1v1035482C1 n=1 Tax=Oldenlandia corymbosa var. corymbosa TaxID=529605 RepID=A0AAV1CTU5_OLDCO|nr:OLC1v1035482C1 [Oldenlandia corymbosa var. corymbosa]
MYYYFQLSCVLGFLVTCAWKTLDFIWFQPRKLEKQLRSQGLPGNSYRPIIGDLREYTKMIKEAESNMSGIGRSSDNGDDIHPGIVSRFIFETAKKYGTDCFIWFGSRPVIIIKDPKLMKEIFLKPNHFHKANFIDPLKSLLVGLIAVEGEKWIKHRRLIKPSFQLEKIKLMLPAFRLSTEEMLATWEESLSPQGSCDLDVWPSLLTLTSDAISRTAFGTNYEEGRNVFELQREQASYVITTIRSLSFPGLRFLPTKKNRRINEIEKVVRIKIRDIIDKRLKARKLGEDYVDKDDLLGILLESNAKEIKQKNGLTIEDVIEECKHFYLAGQETTSILLVWTLILLSRHQDWQSRARDEVFQVFGRKQIDFDGLNQLKVVTMIFAEVLRLYPSVPVLMRETREERKLGEFKIPAGVLLSLQVWMLHRDFEVWGDDAEEFKPERFRDGISSTLTTKDMSQLVAFVPFGWGPRICIGQNFAMIEAKLTLAMILQRFTFHLSPSYEHEPQTLITQQPQHGANLILHKL